MLILDKQKAVEHIVALTAGVAETPAEQAEQSPRPRARTYHRIAVYERRPPAELLRERRGIERRRRRMRLVIGVPSAT
jgi:hypothetical protein